MEDQNIQNEKLLALGSIAGGVAHDLNNILMAVLGHISFLKLTETSSNSKESIEAAEAGLKRAAKLTQQILNFTRKDENLGIKKCDLCELFKSSIPLVSPSLPENITLGLKLQDQVIEVLADETQVTQIILNLLVNARDAMPRGGKISIGIETVEFKLETEINGFKLNVGLYGKLSVTDQGHGIDPNIRTKIFDPFFTTKRGTGTGIGLATVFFLVKSLGGAIEMSSVLNSGTTFEVYLPLANKPHSNSNSHVSRGDLSVTPDLKNTGKVERDLGNKKDGVHKILVVDDEDAVRLVLQRSLEILGFEVVAAENGDVALSYYSKNPTSFSLIVMDMIMPNMPGEELFFHLKALDQNVKVLISSGYAGDGKTQELLKQGAKGFIQKPFAIEELAREVKSVLGI